MLKVVPLFNVHRVKSIVRSMPIMFDYQREDLNPSDFLSHELYSRRPYPVAYLIIAKPHTPVYEPVSFGRDVMQWLSIETCLDLDWAGAAKPWGDVWVVVKCQAVDRVTRKRRFFMIDRKLLEKFTKTVNHYDSHSQRTHS